MQKLYIALSLVLIGFHSSFGQSPVLKVTQSYFRSDPFKTDFSSFLKHLLNDPTLTDKVIEKRTDTSLFYFEGAYARHNPFFFTPKKVKVILAEIPVPLDSLQTDTIYTYQLLAYADNTKEGSSELKKEFEKIYRHYKKGFYKTTLTEVPATANNNATYNFFDALHAVAPFALTWTGPDSNNNMILVLTIRMSIHNNEAILPVPFYTL